MKSRLKQVRCKFNLYPLYEENEMKLCQNDINHIYALQIENISESDSRSYEATKAATNKAPMGFEPMRYRCDALPTEL